MQIKSDSYSFPILFGSGPQSTTVTVTMDSAISNATAILNGFIAQFSGGRDRPLGELDIQVTVPPGGIGTDGTTVMVNVTYGLRDWSGNWDDNYDGTIFFTVIGE